MDMTRGPGGRCEFLDWLSQIPSEQESKKYGEKEAMIKL